MIRRGWPLGSAAPERWVLITQPEHARLSHELAAAWGGPAVPPLVCPPNEPDHPLAGVRAELLDAIRHHDDGWDDRLDAPRIDPELGRPLSFTEMPAADAQRIWADSIDACRKIGPLAGWVVASHFSALQSQREGEHPEWDGWLAENNTRRDAWLAEWLAASPLQTAELADRCLAWLQAFDWMSLWLCCYAPAEPRDAPPEEPLQMVGDRTGWPPICFVPRGPGSLVVKRWPFIDPEVSLTLSGGWVVACGDRVGEPPATATQPVRILWRLSASLDR